MEIIGVCTKVFNTLSFLCLKKAKSGQLKFLMGNNARMNHRGVDDAIYLKRSRKTESVVFGKDGILVKDFGEMSK